MTRTVLVTGGNRGIGQQVARELARAGWDVLIGARDKAKADATAARLRKDVEPASGKKARVKGVELDVASDASVATAVQKLRDGAVKIDALVNNAGIYRSESAANVIETNFFGPLRVTLGMLPLLVEGATITNVTSGLGGLSNLDAKHRALLSDPALTRDALVAAIREFVASDGDWGTDAYGVSKAALNALTRILAVELSDQNIKVNSTCPGWVRTDMGGRNAPRSVEDGAASVLWGIEATATGGVYRDGRKVGPD